MKKNTPQDVWRFIAVRGEDECWQWTGRKTTVKDGNGYGYIAFGGKSYVAHRVVYALSVDSGIGYSAPKNKKERGFVLHHCDNRTCCNPKHLFLGNYDDNNKDAARKGRSNAKRGSEHHFRISVENAPRGTRNGKAIFSDWDIRFIRHWLNNGYGHREIGRQFKSAKTTIGHIKNGRTWSHVDG